MACRHGRSPRGQRLIAPVPYGHWKTSTFIAGPRQGGLAAPLVPDGAMHGDGFRAYVTQCPAPALRAGDTAVMDNPPTRKVAGIREAIAAAGARLLYLPPYSPDLNPAGQVLAKFETLLCKAARRAVDGLWNTIGSLMDGFPPDECANFIAHAGYGQS